MQTFTAFMILSAERAGLSAAENAQRTAFLKRQLDSAGLDPMPVTGMYEGLAESSFLIWNDDPGTAETVSRLAETYQQESVLHVDANREAYLTFTDGRTPLELGHWHAISPTTAATEATSYTRTPDGRYFAASRVAPAVMPHMPITVDEARTILNT